MSLGKAKTKIHISYDLWSSLNSLAILGVIVYYITRDRELRHAVLVLKEINSTYTRENLLLVVLEVIINYRFKLNLGFFVIDNTSNNNTIINYLSICTFTIATIHVQS